jgi:hypothetical protein
VRIEQGIEDWRATGATLAVPYYLALKAEALHIADPTPELLPQKRRHKRWPKDLKMALLRRTAPAARRLFTSAPRLISPES